MVHIRLSKLKPATDVLAGAALGEKHQKQILATICSHPGQEDAILILDFHAITAVTPSYLKQTLGLLCASGEQPINPVFPLYSNLSPSTEDDLHHFLLANRLPGIVVRWGNNAPLYERRIGWLEAAPNETFSRLSRIRAGSASDLMKTPGGSAVALTAWNNRLAELFRLRLATRSKVGRYWIYKPIVEVRHNG